MLKIEEKQDQPPTLSLSGKVSGPWVGELQRVWAALCGEHPKEKIKVDLAQVVFVDSKGKELLGSMLDEGAEFVNPKLLTGYILDELKSSRIHRG